MQLVFLPRFLHDFSRKIFIMLYSINWTNFIVWLPLHLEIFGNKMRIIIICFPVDDVMNLKTILSFFIDLFFYMTKNIKKIFKYLKNEKKLYWSKWNRLFYRAGVARQGEKMTALGSSLKVVNVLSSIKLLKQFQT